MRRILLLFFLLPSFLFAQLRIGVRFYPHFSAEGLFGEKKYSVFLIEFLNTGKEPLRIGENFLLITSEGRKYRPRPAPWLRKEIRDRFGIREKFIWIGRLPPGERRTKIVVFNPIPEDCQEVTLYIFGLSPGKILLITFRKQGEERWRETVRRWKRR